MWWMTRRALFLEPLLQNPGERQLLIRQRELKWRREGREREVGAYTPSLLTST
jgi:hypothetical protein